MPYHHAAVPMRVLVACEFSGTVRRAFAALGHDAWSCDLLPADDGSNHHIVGDARDILGDGWDLLIVAHPPCTRLCNSGVRWLSVPPPGRERDDVWRELEEGAALFSDFLNAPIERIAVENPVMHRHAKALIRNYRPPAQSVQPWQFGHPESKRTCLWLKNLPPLVPTNIVDGREQRVFRMPPSPDRWRERSRFFDGIAAAMAAQWTAYVAGDPFPPISSGPADDMPRLLRFSAGTMGTILPRRGGIVPKNGCGKSTASDGGDDGDGNSRVT